MNTPFSQKRILLGVTGSIAAYKAADLASKLAQSGALVDVIQGCVILLILARSYFFKKAGK